MIGSKEVKAENSAHVPASSISGYCGGYLVKGSSP